MSLRAAISALAPTRRRKENKMTDHEINAAIAEALGWSNIQLIEGVLQGHTELCVKRNANYFLPISDYCNDLNAMHEAEKWLLNNKPLLWAEYKNGLWQMFCALPGQLPEKATGQLNGDDTLHATARQRAEAFLKTVGKWKD